MNNGKYEESLNYFDKALEIDPDYVWSWELKANALIFLARPEEAVKCLDTILNFNPDSIEGPPGIFGLAWYGKGLISEQLGKYEETIEYFKKAI